MNKTFTIEKYGIGFKKGDAELRGKVNDATEKMIDDGSWKALQEKNFAGSGFSPPIAPAVYRY
nr:transporter substrate-binding domain-containing protein [Nocardia salmonicida]